MDACILGKRIAELRKAKGFTQNQLASILHVTDGAISKWERGINFLDLSIMEPLANALGVTVVELLSLESASNQEIITSVFTISLSEKRELLKEMRKLTIRDIIYEVIILFSLLYASKIFDSYQIYGHAQSVTLGMSGFVGTLIGSEIFKLRRLQKFFKK